jgi:hypothetical protein
MLRWKEMFFSNNMMPVGIDEVAKPAMQADHLFWMLYL